MRSCFILVFVLWLPGSARPQEGGDEPGRLLALAGKARGKEARDLLNQVIRALAEDKKSKPREAVLSRLSREIERSAQTQKEIQAIFGEKTPKTAARQIFFRRYRELWVFEQPALTVVFDCIKGKEPKVLTVYPSGEN
jgi:hypothetical protein